MAFSLSLCGAIFLNDAQAKISAVLPSVSSEQIQRLILGTSNSFLGSLSPEDRLTVLNALVASLRKM
jgi:hypothetical protein